AVLPPASDRAAYIRRIRSALDDETSAAIARYLPRGETSTDLAAAVCRTSERRAADALALPGLTAMGPWSKAIDSDGAPDVLVTNVPVIYGWRDGVALHALVRGGLIGGFTSFAGRGRWQGGAIVTVWPLLPAASAVRDLDTEPLAGED